MIEQFILFAATLLLGFWLGHSTQPVEDVKEKLSKQ